MTEFFDSHCHLADTAFQDDLEAVFCRAVDAGVTRLVVIASDAGDADRVRRLVRARTGVWGTAGIHPHEAAQAADGDLERVRVSLADPGMVAVGEVGLDYHHDPSPRPVQRRLFDAQLALGHELDLPVVVHARDADADVAAALRNMLGGTRGVLHCFTAGLDLLETAVERDWYVSLSGIVSFRSFDARPVLDRVPAERLLIETDSPYLAPVPHRGRRNEPAFVTHVAEAVAGHLGVGLEDVARRTTDNALRFYGLEGTRERLHVPGA